MKKFIVVFVILILLGGAGFFFGWVQFNVPLGSYGVLNSKTHGVDPRIIKSGEFRWVWYKLIPTNVTISVFRIEPVQKTISSRGSLPSGDVYSVFAGEQMDFSWEFNASFSFSLDPQSLTSLVQENSIVTQDDLVLYQQSLTSNIESFILQTLTRQENTSELEDFLTGLDDKLEKSVLEKFPFIYNFSCNVRNARFPDFILYRQVRHLYEDYISMQGSYSASSLNRQAENRVDLQMRIEELERYGELLTKYPILLDYLSQLKDQSAQ